MKTIIILIVSLAFIGSGCVSTRSSLQKPDPIAPVGGSVNSCIRGTESMPWYQGSACGEMTGYKGSDRAPSFVSASVVGMIWNEDKDEFTAKPGSQVTLSLTVKNAESVSLEKLIWNEGSSSVVASYPLQKQKDGRFKIVFLFPDFQSFKNDTTYGLRAENLGAPDISQVHLKLGSSWRDLQRR